MKIGSDESLQKSTIFTILILNCILSDESNNNVSRLLPIKELYSYLQGLVQKRLWLQVIIGMFLELLWALILPQNRSGLAKVYWKR